MRFPLTKSNYGPIGLNLGTYGARILQLERVGDGWRARAAASTTFTPASDSEGRAETLAAVIRQLYGSATFIGRKIVSCLPPCDVQVKNLRLPRMSADELKSAVKREASDRLRLDSDSYTMQFFDAGEVRQADEVREEVIGLAASTSVINDHLALLAEYDLEPVAIYAAPSALARFVDCNCINDDLAPPRVVLDVGYSSSKVIICRGRRVVFFKLVDIGGRTFDEALADNLNMSRQDAAQLRRSQTNPSLTDGTGKPPVGSQRHDNIDREVYDALRPIVSELVREVSLYLCYYSVTFRGNRPDTIALVGGEAYQPHLVELLSNNDPGKVEVIAPLQNVDVSNVERLAPTDWSLSEWALVVGLAMCQVIGARKRGAA